MNAIDHIITVPGYPEPNSKTRLKEYNLQGGGQIGNSLAALARLGLKTRCLGKVGDDWQGELSLKLLKEAGVDVSFVIQEKNCTNQFAFIIVDERNGNRTIMAHRHKKLEFEPGDFPKKAILSGKILFLDGSGKKCSLDAIRLAQKAGIPVVLDVERMKDYLEDMLGLADVIIAAETFKDAICPGENWEKFLEIIFRKYSPRYCGITLGEKGSAGFDGKNLYYAPSYPARVADTTGAGDIYHAAFIFGLLQEWDIGRVILFSNAAAGLKCEHIGARAGAPEFEEVERLMEENTNIKCKVYER